MPKRNEEQITKLKKLYHPMKPSSNYNGTTSGVKNYTPPLVVLITHCYINHVHTYHASDFVLIHQGVRGDF